MKEDFKTLPKQRILVADGAMGTMLQAAGLPPGHCLEEWNVSNPLVISEIHKQYIEAGADMIEIIKQLRAVTDFPLIAQANAGLPEIVGEFLKSICHADGNPGLRKIKYIIFLKYYLIH